MAVSTLTHSFPNGHSLLLATPGGTAITARQVSGLSSVKADVSIESVARYFGGSGYIANKMTIDRIGLAIDEVANLITPKGTYTLCSISVMNRAEKAGLENSWRLSVPECFADPGARLVATAIGTLGDKLEKQCRHLANIGEIYESTLLDAVGTAMLDLLGEKIYSTIGLTGKRYGLEKGFRFAPGLDSYPLERQKLLFEIADNESVGVFLNSSVIMMPTKSISFFLVLTKTAQKTAGIDKCSSCRLTGCLYRAV